MGDRVRVVHDEQGRLVALKSPPPDDPERTRREAAMLASIDHPGVVAFLGLDEGAGRPEVRTTWVGSRRAADLPRPLAPVRAAGLVLAVGTIVADLHRMGVVHGALDATHVVLDPYGRPVLCGMGSASRLGPTDRHGEAVRAATDVAGLGRLLRQLLSAPDPDEEPDAPPVPAARRREDRRTAARRRRLLALAEQAEDPEPDARPGLQALLASVREVVPEAALGRDAMRGAGTESDPLVALLADAGSGAATDEGLRTSTGPDGYGGPAAEAGSAGAPGDPASAGRVVIDAPTAGATFERLPGSTPPDLGAETAGQLFRDLARLRPDGLDALHGPRPGRGTWMRTAAAIAALGLASFVGLSALRGGDGAATVAPPDRPIPTTTAASRPPGSTDRTPPTTAATTVPTSSGSGTSGAAPVVEHAGRRFAVGEPGDLAAVGDWTCDGRPRVVLYRPTSGSLFVFEGWPDTGGSVETRAVTAVPGGTALATHPGAGGCPVLSVTGGGPQVTIDPELLR